MAYTEAGSQTVRYARRTDTTQQAIVKGLRAAGWSVWIIKEPCDLLLYKAGRGMRTLECKSPANKKNEPKLDKRQVEQAEFCRDTNTPYVVTPEQAIEAVESGCTA